MQAVVLLTTLSRASDVYAVPVRIACSGSKCCCNSPPTGHCIILKCTHDADTAPDHSVYPSPLAKSAWAFASGLTSRQVEKGGQAI